MQKPHNHEIGERIGDYEIVSTVGAGGMGKVFQVRNIISERVEAMKVLLPDLEYEPELADRFAREIKVQASLQHANIAALHTALRIDNQLLMLMEWIEGTTLEQRLQKGPILVRDGIDYIGQVLGALSYAHQHGVIHRDVKPANMMLTPNGMVKLMDFGIAKSAADRKLTMTGTSMGSVDYMSPEQIKGMANLDARSDLYSVGISMYEIVVGKKPFGGDSQFAIMAAHVGKTPVPPRIVDPKLPPALNDLIMMAIAKDPGNRFQSASAFQAALVSVQRIMEASTPTSAIETRHVRLAPPVPGNSTGIGAAPRSPWPRGLWLTAYSLALAAALMSVILAGPQRATTAVDKLPSASGGATAASVVSRVSDPSLAETQKPVAQLTVKSLAPKAPPTPPTTVVPHAAHGEPHAQTEHAPEMAQPRRAPTTQTFHPPDDSGPRELPAIILDVPPELMVDTPLVAGPAWLRAPSTLTAPPKRGRSWLHPFRLHQSPSRKAFKN